ncbi:glutamate dehydrogenase, partial [Escherichia coli]|nr:glutamate dehydrogenase [Escherichia coli]
GLLFVINEAIKRFKMTPPQTRVVVQGAGNVGGTAARLLHEAGYKVIAISDIHGGIYNPNGLDIPAALDYLQRTRSFEDYP